MTDARLDPVAGPHDHVRGMLGAPSTLVQYGDFQCPYCRRAAPMVHELRRRLGDDLCFVFRHFPLADVHPFALAAAVAAEAAATVGRFWPMHDALYESDGLRQDDLRVCARRAGVDPESVVWPATRLVEERVEVDFDSGVRSGVRGTPSFFVGDRPYTGDLTVDALSAALRSAAGEPTEGSVVDGPAAL